MEDLDAWLDKHPNARIVVIDTLARVRPPQKTYSNAYYDDYTTIATLKKIADQHKVALGCGSFFCTKQGGGTIQGKSRSEARA